ncbi:Pimeloyl-ACP methyl ester carboxylesterase [Seinonella peptonophila]|uniref:Pimeloyl-ACP methyl ester carboxylesterase n=1 Tax=Seinonella peptonophila TaxID=112248 RepID=A0A1M4TYR6_9BACL|nr:Pimeloyl-ACP methyl ester carboxylesterase [Seinonella peptonophila]
MHQLGYQQFAVHGGDIGAHISLELGVTQPKSLLGIHVLQVFAFPNSPEEMEKLSEEEMKRLHHMFDFQKRAGYLAIQSTRPLTLAYSLTDSPIGQLSWSADFYAVFGDTIDEVDKDFLLTNVMIYWITQTANSSSCLYFEDEQSGVTREKKLNTVPTGVAVFPNDFQSFRRFAERENHIVHWSEFDQGGHFAAIEEPESLVGDIRTFFKEIRNTR